MSRLLSTQERKRQRKAVFLILLSLALLFGLFFYGPGAIGQVTSFVLGFKNTEENPLKEDKTPPVAPNINSIAEATQEPKVIISGSAEADSTLKVFRNGQNLKETLIDKTAAYSLEVSLEKGKNSIWVTATDKAGNESQQSRTLTIIYDTEPPDLAISSPQDGETFYGSDKTIEITGTTERESKVTINERVAIVGSEGEFSLNFTLEEGENTLNFKAVDAAGNETEKEIKVTYNP